MIAEVRPAPREARLIIERLLDSYLKELSPHREIAAGTTDAASYPYLPLYWEEPDRFPFTLWRDGEVAGFALVRRIIERECGPVMQMAEFYVVPAHRRQGLGSAAAAALWRRFPGAWEFQVHAPNQAAQRFWRRCIDANAVAESRVEEVAAHDGRRSQFSFEIS